jgi:iron complex outermembrane receptor protein
VKKSFLSNQRTLFVACCTLVPTFAPFCSHAAESPDGTQLTEIIVTAQKRAENIQTVPVSAQVVTGQALGQQNFNTLEQLTQMVPDVHVANSGSFSNDLYIRGIGSGSNSSFDQSVATFNDDIYHGRSRLSGATFLDLDRIEILKGPQSTFFGNNAIAGALNIITKKPGDSLEGAARLLYGQFGQYAGEGAITLPISDTFSARLAVIRNGESGWITNVNTGQKAPDENNEAGRGTFLFKPTDNFEATFKIEASENKTSGTPADLPLQWNNCPRPPPVGASAPSTFCRQALALGDAVPMGIDSNLNTGLPGQGNTLSTFEDVLTLSYHDQWNQTVTSVTGFYNYHFEEFADEGHLPIQLLDDVLAEKYHQFSQEVRIASPTSGSFHYLAGLYFQTDNLNYHATAIAPELNPVVESKPALAPLIPYLPVDILPGFSQEEHVYSIFGSASWNVTDLLTLNAGIRGSWVNKDTTGTLTYGTSSQIFDGFTPIPPALVPLWGIVLGTPGVNSIDRSDHAWMPSASVQYQIVPEVMSYASYTRGFKAGGINGQNGLGVPTELEYGPETVNAYELGLKSKWLDDRVLVNVDLFRSDYNNLQVLALLYHPESNVYTSEIANAAKSRSEGVEMETQWAATRALRFSANITYLHSYYVSFPNASPTTLAQINGQKFSDLSGDETNYAPHWSGNVTASYTVPVGSLMNLTAQLSPYFTSSYYTQSADPFFVVPAYTRLDARVTLASQDGRWALDVIGKNLANRVIVAVPGVYNEAKEEPRNVAVQLRYHF